MANLRQLKKAIDSEIYGVISDCFAWNELHSDGKSDDVAEIISDAVDLRNDLISRVNHPGSSAVPKDIRAHYQLIGKDLDSGVDALFERLSSASKKKKK